jgi:hypothetical protein
MQDWVDRCSDIADRCLGDLASTMNVGLDHLKVDARLYSDSSPRCLTASAQAGEVTISLVMSLSRLDNVASISDWPTLIL